ncbi:MAG: holo-ACP synthase [Thermoleophilaceae bacterium]|nr:holo-ACP synthase [Thermoleophilaceae bacterium]
MADVEGAVREAVVEVLALDDDEVTPQSTLMDDLGAESIDLLDILFRIEKSTGVQIEGRLHADEVMSLSTVQNLVDMVKGRAEGARAPGDPPRVPRRLRVGVDVVGVARLERVVGGDERRQASLFTPGELAYCHGKRRCYEHMAARFAAKEAVLKAFGTGISQRMRWTDVEVVNESSGRPRIELDGAVATFAREHGLEDLDVSLTHGEGLALAHAVSIWERPGEAAPAALR